MKKPLNFGLHMVAINDQDPHRKKEIPMWRKQKAKANSRDFLRELTEDELERALSRRRGNRSRRISF